MVCAKNDLPSSLSPLTVLLLIFSVVWFTLQPHTAHYSIVTESVENCTTLGKK